MRKVQITAVFWTLVLAVPLTALGISLAAYLTDHLGEIITSVATLGMASSLGGLGWLAEFSARWPELAGMVVGQLVIMLILIVVRREKLAEDDVKQ
ncbi:MAG: hypothetical protein ACKOC5_04690 [Chloroflexota bacterium]